MSEIIELSQSVALFHILCEVLQFPLLCASQMIICMIYKLRNEASSYASEQLCATSCVATNGPASQNQNHMQPPPLITGGSLGGLTVLWLIFVKQDACLYYVSRGCAIDRNLVDLGCVKLLVNGIKIIQLLPRNHWYTILFKCQDRYERLRAEQCRIWAN